MQLTWFFDVQFLIQYVGSGKELASKESFRESRKRKVLFDMFLLRVSSDLGPSVYAPIFQIFFLSIKILFDLIGS